MLDRQTRIGPVQELGPSLDINGNRRRVLSVGVGVRREVERAGANTP